MGVYLKTKGECGSGRMGEGANQCWTLLSLVTRERGGGREPEQKEQCESPGHPTHLGAPSDPGNQCGIWVGFHWQQNLGKLWLDMHEWNQKRSLFDLLE